MKNFEDIELKVVWEVYDDYVGGSRPHTTKICPSDGYDEDEWNELSEDEKKQFIEECVEEDFKTKISFNITDYDL